ncbi:hypothetical protein PG994_004431 [Apiospora phragmitis]|uniref:Uncharacterized protein n=1 Tax=Apiospora phragmitis TaxID=2905665 RepID=A0ABR1VQP3_9PEZI
MSSQQEPSFEAGQQQQEDWAMYGATLNSQMYHSVLSCNQCGGTGVDLGPANFATAQNGCSGSGSNDRKSNHRRSHGNGRQAASNSRSRG